MNPAMIAMALQMLQSGKLDSLSSSLPGLSSILGPFKGLMGTTTPADQASLNVQGAIQILADHMPAGDSTAYLAAVTQALQGLAAMKKLAAT